MKILKKALISLVCIIAFLGVVVIGGYIFVRSKYGIDLFRTAGQLKVLSQKVDESVLCPNAFGEEDFENLKDALNTSLVDGFITHSEGNGYNGYGIDYKAVEGITDISEFTSIKIAEKQAGALGQIIFYNQTGGKISVSGKDLPTTIKQVDFSNIENGNADLNIVVYIDLTPFTAEMTGFPYSLFKKYIPDSLYVSSTVFVKKTDSAMGYEVSHKELKINNLSSEDTADLFHTLDTVLKIGTAENLNLTIGNTVAQVLIGNSKNSGFAYSLSENGLFNTYNFKTIDEIDCFVIEKNS